MIDLAIDDRVKIDSVIDAALQELDILFNTTCTELIGNTSFGTNFESFLWDFSVSEDTIKRYIMDVINNNTTFMKRFDYNINVTEVPGDHRSIFYVQIDLKPDPFNDITDDDPKANKLEEKTMPKTRRVYMLR